MHMAWSSLGRGVIETIRPLLRLLSPQAWLHKLRIQILPRPLPPQTRLHRLQIQLPARRAYQLVQKLELVQVLPSESLCSWSYLLSFSYVGENSNKGPQWPCHHPDTEYVMQILSRSILLKAEALNCAQLLFMKLMVRNRVLIIPGSLSLMGPMINTTGFGKNRLDHQFTLRPLVRRLIIHWYEPSLPDDNLWQ